MSLLTPSGGLVYHLRALRYRTTLWAPFRQAIESWLAGVLPGCDELVLVGPSGGHCLPDVVLRRFARLVVLEPDPVARWLLRRRLAPSELVIESEDLLVSPLLRGGSGLVELLASRPEAAVLFCNLLGQLDFSLAEDQRAAFRTGFRGRVLPALEGRSWASFHDRWSLDWPASRGAPLLRTFPSRPTDQDLGVTWFGAEGPPVEVLDHGASELFPTEWPRRYFSWEITPGTLHIVEGVARS